METFKDAQELFSEYEKKSEFIKLRRALKILDEIIYDRLEEHQKAVNLRNTISNHIISEINGILQKIDKNFGKKLKNIENEDIKINHLSKLIDSSLSNSDSGKLIELWKIKSDLL